MGPRLINRGNKDGDKEAVVAALASMGPRLINRGNICDDPDTAAITLLQWGRG